MEIEQDANLHKRTWLRQMRTVGGDSFEMGWDFLASGMVPEVQEEVRLVVNVLESNDQELVTETLFDDAAVMKSRVQALDHQLVR